MNIFWVVPELHREDLPEGIYNQLYDVIYLLFFTFGSNCRMVSKGSFQINGSTPKWPAIEINYWPILLGWSSHEVHAYGTAHMFPMYCSTWALLHFSEECGWRLSGIGLLNQSNYLGPGTSAAYRLPSPNISGTCLAPQSHRLSRPCPIGTPLCHSTRGSITICFKVPLTKQWDAFWKLKSE